MTFLKAIANLFRRKPREKTGYEIVMATVSDKTLPEAPIHVRMAGRCGYARLNAKPISHPPATSSDDK
jgi:hypothetical protein